MKLCLAGPSTSMQASVDGKGYTRASVRWVYLLRSWKGKWTISENNWEFVESGADNVKREIMIDEASKEVQAWIGGKGATKLQSRKNCHWWDKRVWKRQGQGHQHTGWQGQSMVGKSLTPPTFLPTFLSSDSSLQCPNLIEIKEPDHRQQLSHADFRVSTLTMTLPPVEWRIDSNRNIWRVQRQRHKNTKLMENPMNELQASENIMLCFVFSWINPTEKLPKKFKMF